MSIRSGITRRRFLETAVTAAAAPYVITSFSLKGFGRPAPSNRIVMGAIGVGGMGSGDMRAFMGFPEVQMVAVCDVFRDRREKAKAGADKNYGGEECKAYGDFRELLARDDIDAVHVGTPDHWHAITTIRACRSGKDVYCQKPLSLTIREGRAMVGAARRYGRVVSCGSQRVLGDYGGLAREVRSGAIGEPREAFVGVEGPSRPCDLPGEPVPDGLDWDMWLGPAPWAPYNPCRCAAAYGLGGKGWRSWRDYSGGMMTDWGGHKFAAAMFALGLEHTGPVEIIPPDGKDHKLLTYVFANGVRMYHGGGGDITIRGTLGEAGRGRGRSAAGPRANVAMPGYKGQGGIYGDFICCLKTRERPFQDVEIAHRAATVCHLGNIAYWLGRPLKWDPVKEGFADAPEADRWLDRAKREPWQL